MRISLFGAIAAMLPFGVAVGQQRSDGQLSNKLKIVTVCEVLGSVNRYSDTVVAVIGRWEPSVSLTDHYEFLAQDRCQHPVITHGHVWEDKIRVWSAWETGMPKPPSERPRLEPSVVAAKLSLVRKTTRLGFHQEPQFKLDGRSIVYSHSARKANAWAAVYGRLVKVPKLNEDCGAAGCGGDNFPLMLITEPYNVYKLSENGTLLPWDE